MRILIDIQSAQNANRERGIGRYVLSLAKAIAAEPRDHEISFLASAAFPESLHSIKNEIESHTGTQRFHVFDPFGKISALDPDANWRRRASVAIRDAAIAAERPDCVLIGSIFDGYVDDTVISVHDDARGMPTAAVLYDLIPLAQPRQYLASDAEAHHYQTRLAQLRRADAWLAISDFTRRDALARLGLPEENCTSIGAGVDAAVFKPGSDIDQDHLAKRSITRPFIMYAGGADPRKNIDGLVDAYCRLPQPIRGQFQLVLVSSLEEDRARRFREKTARTGSSDDIVITGFLTDAELAGLYQKTALFVMPSQFEGFGLPPLEAMACGAPTIAADNSSLPEVMGRTDALFSLKAPDAMRDKIVEALKSDAFNRSLREHGPRQAAKFTWNASAGSALDALESMAARHRRPRSWPSGARPKLAFVSPLPPSPSGISDYSAELLPELSRHYDIDIVTEEPTTDMAAGSFRARLSGDAFDGEAHRFDRIIYHFGNSPFHSRMFELVRRHPGVVVLHDFFLPWPHIVAANENGDVERLVRALFEGGGYQSLINWRGRAPTDIAKAEPCNLAVLQNAIGLIVHSEHSIDLARRTYGAVDPRAYARVPHLRAPAQIVDRTTSRRRLGITDDEFVIISLGFVAPSKRSLEIADAFLESQTGSGKQGLLVFVGANDGGKYGAELLLRAEAYAGRIRLAGRVSAEIYRDWAAAADLAIQLRANSRGETSGAIFDCFNFSLPTIVNACGSLAEFPEDVVGMLSTDADSREISNEIDRLAGNAGERVRLGAAGNALLRREHSPRHCSDAYVEAIERFYTCDTLSARRGAARLGRLKIPAGIDELAAYAERAAASAAPSIRHRQLLLDCSFIANNDLGSGIQRVIRNVARRWLVRAPMPYRVDLVRAESGDIYRYARELAARWLALDTPGLADDATDIAAGDILLVMDSAWEVQAEQAPFYRRLRAMGAKVYFLVYDILPELTPQYFPEYALRAFKAMMGSLAEADGAICISRTVAGELKAWMDKNAPQRATDFQIEWFHLGADLETTASRGFGLLPAVEMALGSRPTIIMVGTIEPRKGHVQALAAFSTIWAADEDVNLVIVGKTGWSMDAFTANLREHPQLHHRLFWFEDADDATLEGLYARSSALLAASNAEGFGLPLIEAALKKMPIIARDIPVFREVAGEHAFYFSGDSSEALVARLREWLSLYRKNAHPKSNSMPVMTWDASADQLWTRVLDLADRRGDIFCAHGRRQAPGDNEARIVIEDR